VHPSCFPINELSTRHGIMPGYDPPYLQSCRLASIVIFSKVNHLSENAIRNICLQKAIHLPTKPERFSAPSFTLIGRLFSKIAFKHRDHGQDSQGGFFPFIADVTTASMYGLF
jgi:hypothetical protein